MTSLLVRDSLIGETYFDKLRQNVENSQNLNVFVKSHYANTNFTIGYKLNIKLLSESILRTLFFNQCVVWSFGPIPYKTFEIHKTKNIAQT